MMDAAGETVEDVDVVLSKPVTMKELRNALSAVLERKQSGQSAGDDTGER
jgi:DNA-binding response OmpR family regulator